MFRSTLYDPTDGLCYLSSRIFNLDSDGTSLLNIYYPTSSRSVWDDYSLSFGSLSQAIGTGICGGYG